MFAQLPRLACLVRAAIWQRQNPRLFFTVIKGMKAADFIETPLAVERVEVMRIARGQLACLEITATQVRITKRFRALTREKMKAQPAPVHARDALGFSKKRDKQKQNEIGVDLRLELEIAHKIFGSDLADSALELKRCMQGMIEFLHKHDQRPDISVANSRARIVLLELFNEPARIVNADAKLIPCAPQKRARKFAEFPSRFAGRYGQLRAARPINQTIFEIDSDLRVRSFK